VAQQVNLLTAYIDGSMVYGSDEQTAASLRSFSGGRLKTGPGNLLPSDDRGFFVAGDVRANENSELTALQTLFMREHNRLADELAARHSSWSDERLYQQARRLVIGTIQHITYNEFLPALLGKRAMGKYKGYDPRVNPGISNEFATAAYRVGHSMLADDIEFITNDGEEAAPEIELRESFQNPAIVHEHGIDTIIKYLASSNAQEIDNRVVNGLRNFLFDEPRRGGMDLASLNVQRGRDHGLADYNDTRAAIGLPPVKRFSDITSDKSVAARLKSLYGSVDNIDLWVGGLAEDHVRGSSLGPTFQRIIIDQFTRLRSGDRFWYERDLRGSDLAMIRATSLKKVIAANTSISNLQQNVFIFDVDVSGTVFADRDRDGRHDRNERGVRGITLELVDEEGAVVDTVTTDRRGRFNFSQVQIGDFEVRVAGPSGLKLTTAPNRDIDVTRGGDIAGADFGVRTA
jgi:hypothetical protein